MMGVLTEDEFRVSKYHSMMIDMSNVTRVIVRKLDSARSIRRETGRM